MAEAAAVLIHPISDYAIFVLSPEGIIETWNTGAERLKGYSSGEAIGQHFSIFYPPDDIAAGVPARLLDEARADGHVNHSGWRIRQDGTRFWAYAVITAIPGDDGAAASFVKITRDMTAAKQLEEARESFLTGVAHDLKAPITAIEGFARLLHNVEPDLRADLVDRIVANAEDLGALVDDLLDYCRLRAGAEIIEPQLLDLGDEVHGVIARLRPLLGDREVLVDLTAREVRADETALKRVLANLLVNASKFSPGGSTIGITSVADGDRVEVAVSDEGRGFSPDDHERVFDEFERGSLANGSEAGMGVGLTTVRELLRLHDCDVWIDSAPGHGATVRFTLPLGE
jgi:hypothetical protein